MSKFKCNITYKKIPGNSLLSTQNKLRAHGFVDQYWNVKVDVATWREARSELNELASTKLGSKVNLFEEKKLLNGIRAVPVVKYFSMLDRMKKAFDVPISEGVSDVYNSSKELQIIGTKQEYANYVNSIFPNSKIKDVVYHGSPDVIEQFENGFLNKSNLGARNKGIFFTNDIISAEMYSGSFDPFSDYSNPDEGYIYSAVLNINNPVEKDYKGSEFYSQDIDINSVDEKVYDSLIARNISDPKLQDNFIVFDASQIHILGNKSDINKFSNWKQKLLSTDKIIFGHPGIGKSFLRETNNNIIDFDTDYKIKINEEFNLSKGFKALNSWRVNNEDIYKDRVRKLWKDAVNESKKTGKILVASDMLLLREFEKDFDKVITISKDTFINRAKQRNDYTQGETENWKNNLDNTISRVDKNKIIVTDKYLSDLFETIPYQPQFVRDELGVDEIVETNLDSKSTETLIYESIGQRRNSVIKEENISNVRKQIEEFNNKPYGKKLSLVEVKGGWIINSTFTSNYLYSGAKTELDEIEVESKTTDSNRNFNIKCITG